jgi:hypothetical protein
MSNETRDRAREIIRNAVHVQFYMDEHEEYEIADRAITQLDASGIRFAGEGEVMVDSGRFARLQSATRYQVLREGTGFPFLQDGDLDEIGDSDGGE